MDEKLERIGTFVDNVVDDDGTISLRFKTEENFVNIRVAAKAEFPYLSLCNEDSKKKYTNSTSLFIGEGIKLLRYLNTRFNFTDTELLRMNPGRNENVFKSDDFF